MASAPQLRALDGSDADAFQRLVTCLPGDTPTFLHGYRAGMPFAAYLQHLQVRGTDAAVHDASQVAETLLFAFADREIVGRVSIRHRLTPALEALAGHIGYAVLPAWRGQGLATAMLREALVFAHGTLGIGQVIITCDAANHASRRVIENNGAHYLGSITLPDGNEKRRYQIGLGAVLHSSRD